MRDLMPADVLAIVFAAGLALYVGFHLLMWRAGRVIDCLKETAAEPIYQPRCSTAPETNRMARWLAIGIVTLAVVEFALLAARAYGCGQ